MHCLSLAILSHLSRFHSSAVGTNWPILCWRAVKHQTNKQICISNVQFEEKEYNWLRRNEVHTKIKSRSSSSKALVFKSTWEVAVYLFMLCGKSSNLLGSIPRLWLVKSSMGFGSANWCRCLLQIHVCSLPFCLPSRGFCWFLVNLNQLQSIEMSEILIFASMFLSF